MPAAFARLCSLIALSTLSCALLHFSHSPIFQPTSQTRPKPCPPQGRTKVHSPCWEATSQKKNTTTSISKNTRPASSATRPQPRPSTRNQRRSAQGTARTRTVHPGPPTHSPLRRERLGHLHRSWHGSAGEWSSGCKASSSSFCCVSENSSRETETRTRYSRTRWSNLVAISMGCTRRVSVRWGFLPANNQPFQTWCCRRNKKPSRIGNQRTCCVNCSVSVTHIYLPQARYR